MLIIKVMSDSSEANNKLALMIDENMIILKISNILLNDSCHDDYMTVHIFLDNENFFFTRN